MPEGVLRPEVNGRWPQNATLLVGPRTVALGDLLGGTADPLHMLDWQQEQFAIAVTKDTKSLTLLSLCQLISSKKNIEMLLLKSVRLPEIKKSRICTTMPANPNCDDQRLNNRADTFTPCRCHFCFLLTSPEARSYYRSN